MATSTRAVIAYEPLTSGAPNFKIETLTLRELKENELLVKMVASGICHTDIVVGSMPAESRGCPLVTGHEGTLRHLTVLTVLYVRY
jgi:Zn-dependent alcohol dehydrogenase